MAAVLANGGRPLCLLLLLLLTPSCLLVHGATARRPGYSAGDGDDIRVRGQRVPDEQRLYETIMSGYQRSVLPRVTNTSHSLTIAFSLRLNQIVSLDERKQVLTTNVFIDQTWIDPALAWDPANFTDVRALRIPCEHVWLPDTFVYNNADGGTSGFMRGTYVQIQSNGRVLWPVPLRLRSSCSVRINYFPFDSQLCRLQFGSWIYRARQLDYQPLTDGLTVDLSTYVNNSEWELVAITLAKELSPPGGPPHLRPPGLHPRLTYVLHLRRNTFFYLFNIIVPCVMLSTLNILTFWLPPVSGEKVTLGLSVFLAFSMFMLLIAEEVPATSEAVPLIGVYLCMVMTMTSLSVIMAVVVTNLYHRGRKMRQAPRWLVALCLRWLATPCCVTADIPLIASSVNLVEHCQYNVSHKRKSQPNLAALIAPDSPPPTPTQPPSTPPTSSSPVFLPPHLQNGGLPAGHGLDLGGCVRESRSGRRPPPLLVKELHPRARNSVVRSCRFARLPDPTDTLPAPHAEEGEEEEEVWVRRRDLGNPPASPSETRGLLQQTDVITDSDEDDSASCDNKVRWTDDNDVTGQEWTGVTEQSDVTGPENVTTRQNQVTGRKKDAATRQRDVTGRNDVTRQNGVTRNESERRAGEKLDPHPSVKDLQWARTMIAEWQQIATVVDRLMFVLYVLTTVTAYVVILVIVPANQPPLTAVGEGVETSHNWGG